MSKISDIFHYEGLTYWGPISPERMESILDRMPLAPGLKATDIGCGRGELLIRLAERCGAQVTGVDFSRNALDLARLALSTRAPDVAGRFVKADARAYTSDGAQDLISWLGGPFLGDDLAETLVVLNSWLRPGGHLLIGQGFWASPPPAAYLEATGISEDEMGTHWENIALAEASGLRLLYAGQSNRDEWDHFEGVLQCNVERYATEHPQAPDPQGRLDARRGFYRAQQRWGRETLGFGIYLFQKPLEPAA